MDEIVARSFKSTFHARFGTSPTAGCECPGRVNLIGEHIDYSGYAVLPIAIDQRIKALFSFSRNQKISIQNSDSIYQEFECDNLYSSWEMNTGRPKWYHYVLCGYKGAREYLADHPEIEQKNAELGMQILITGEVPPNAGLSSSSALVCCSVLATIKLYTGHDFDIISKSVFASIAASCERYIGTEGGGMDQAVSFMAEKGMAQLIEFHPLRSQAFRLPDDAVFVVCNSCVELNKAATSDFNERVVECRIAAKVLAAKSGVDWSSVKRLGDIHSELQIDLDAMTHLVCEHLHQNSYSKKEICDILNISVDAFTEDILTQNTKTMDQFQLYKRALHCYTEAARVYKFHQVCTAWLEGSRLEEPLKNLGAIMTAGHQSCRDLYECSCPELDQLVSLCLETGAFGARLTGAGWGGCAVALVKRGTEEDFVKALHEKFYIPKGKTDPEELKKLVFVTAPAHGAGVFEF